MYVLDDMEDAGAGSRKGDIFASNAAGTSRHSWDEAGAFYAGSLEGVGGFGNGYLLYNFADER